MAAAGASVSGAGKSGMIATMAILTLLAGGGGALVGKLVASRLQVSASTAATVADTPKPYSGEIEVRELAPIVTDLAGQTTVRVRLQVAVVFARKAVENPSVLVAQVGDDILAFLKTLTLDQLQGPSGLQNLREDLNEHAAVRSQGAVREVIIETLVTQ